MNVKIDVQNLVFAGLGLLVGMLLAGYAAGQAVNTNNRTMMNMMGMHTGHIGMSNIMGNLDGKTGDEFDKAFLTEMIIHHQGAVGMAELAKQNAKHDEIKKLADDIMSAQSKEIDMMQTWQSEWGYKQIPRSHGMVE